jgi:IS5 family transposase
MRRHRDQKLLDRARRQANTKQAKLDRKRRQDLMERSFADASNLHGFKRARWRGLIKQSIQDLLIATVQNLRKLDRSDPKRPGKCLQTSDPNSLAAIYAA